MLRGRGSLVSQFALPALVLAVVAAALVGAAATGALPATTGDGQPDAETVLERAGERYANAESVVVEADVTVATPADTESATVSYAAAKSGGARVVVTRDGDRYAAGTNGSVAWVQPPGGAVVALPVPDVNGSRLVAAVENRSAPERFANRTVPALTENGSVPELPANWTHDDLPANWTHDELPANWSAAEITSNESLHGVLANRSRIARLLDNGSFSGHNWSVPDGYNWSAFADFNSSMLDEPDRSTLGEYNRSTLGEYNRSTLGEYNWSALWSDTDYAGPNVTVETTGTETVDGVETYVIELRSTGENESLPGNATLWVATGDYAVRRAQATADGYRVTVDVTTTRFNASIRESTFRPPDGTGLSVAPRATYGSFDAAQADTSISLARLDGYAFANATVATRGGQTVAVQQYVGTDGQRVALVATPGSLPLGLDEGTPVTVAGASATYVEVGERGAVVWTADGVTRAVVADLPRAGLVDLAATVRN